MARHTSTTEKTPSDTHNSSCSSILSYEKVASIQNKEIKIRVQILLRKEYNSTNDHNLLSRDANDEDEEIKNC